VAVIIGNSTSVVLSIASAGIQSVDWSAGGNTQRLYTLGGGYSQCGANEFAIIRSAEIQVNFSIYGGNTTPVSTCPLEGCANSPAVVTATIVPAICGGGSAQGLNSQPIFINSYSYSKERTKHGTESWAGTAYVTATALGPTEYCEPVPSFVVLGIAEGTIEGDGEDDLQELAGAYFRDSSPIQRLWKGQVQADQLGVGDFTFSDKGTFKQIGGSKFWDPNKPLRAKASVTLSLQPVYTS
jgi:hypothetical protein